MQSANFKFNRILASLIDGFIMLLLLIAVCTVPTISLIRDIIKEASVVSDALWLGFSLFGTYCLWILYLFLSALVFRNATLGMRINHLVFKKTNGNNMTARTLLFRETAVVFCIVFSFGFTLIFDPISVICSENGKNFYDIFSSTKVVDVNDL